MTAKYEGIDFKPPEAVANAAKKGLEYRAKASPSNKGGLTPSEASKEGIGSGVSRATTLKNRKNVSPDTIKQMVSFFARHNKNKSVSPEHKSEPWNDKGYVSWLLWGGDPGQAWAEKVKAQMEKADMKKTARSNAKFVELPAHFHPVTVQPAKAKREEFPFEGFIDFQGIKIDVENVKGSTRSGKGPEGEWSIYCNAHYGEIRNTEGVDGDKLDVYVGDNHDSSLVVVIHQHNPWDGQYDEDKVMLGFDSVEEAIGAYKKQYDRPGFFKEGQYTAMPIGSFWRWVCDRGNKGKRVKLARKVASMALAQTPAQKVVQAYLAERKDLVPGGLGDKTRAKDVDPKQLAKGVEVEMEHTRNKDLAREIALDHLTEMGDYYTRLEKVEKKASSVQVTKVDHSFDEEDEFHYTRVSVGLSFDTPLSDRDLVSWVKKNWDDVELKARNVRTPPPAPGKRPAYNTGYDEEDAWNEERRHPRKGLGWVTVQNANPNHADSIIVTKKSRNQAVVELLFSVS